MGVGRILCVALPFILTACSLICLLVTGLAGVADKSLYMFRVNTTGLEFNPTELDSLEDLVGRRSVDADDILKRSPTEWHDPSLLRDETSSGSSSNVTADDLGIDYLYDISLWGYCSTDSDGDRTCTKAKFDWANGILNETLEDFSSAAALAGQEIALPDAVESAMTAFATVTKWTEVAYVAAMIGLGVELFFGVFASCSRAWGCITFIVASVAAVLVCAAASLSTAMAVVVVGTVEATAKYYGVRSNFNTTFLAFAWLAAAFALAAGFFWMFTVCCCASSHPSSRRGYKARSIGDGEKNVPTGSYQPLGEQHEMTPAPFYSSGGNYGRTRQAPSAYEPYSHHNA